MTFKSKILSGLLALAVAAPLALGAVPASAAPRHVENMMGGHHDVFHDRGHRPPMRAEHRPSMPHHGHYRWHDGSWGWRNGAWVWAPGLWIKF